MIAPLTPFAPEPDRSWRAAFRWLRSSLGNVEGAVASLARTVSDLTGTVSQIRCDLVARDRADLGQRIERANENERLRDRIAVLEARLAALEEDAQVHAKDLHAHQEWLEVLDAAGRATAGGTETP